MSANINPDQITLLSAAIMVLYCACLAAYDDISDTHTSKYQPPIAYTPRWDWTIEGANAECLAYFRFSKSEIRELLPHSLRLPSGERRIDSKKKKKIRELIVHLKLSDWVFSPRPHRYARSPERALCMLLYRFSSPGRLIQIFGVSQGHTSSIVNDLASYLYTQFQPVLYWNLVRLSLQRHTAAVTATVGVQELGIWGFIDATVRPIARPLSGWLSGWLSGTVWCRRPCKCSFRL